MNSLPFYYFSELKEYLDITKMSYSNPMKFSDPNEWILPDSELLKEVGIRCFYTFETTDKRSTFEIIKDLKEIQKLIETENKKTSEEKIQEIIDNLQQTMEN